MHKNWKVSFYYQYQQVKNCKKSLANNQELLIYEPPQLPVLLKQTDWGTEFSCVKFLYIII